MSENTEMDPHAKIEPAGDRVGDILRKERITRRIALETIAKDLKLNVKYIKSLEANDYSDLPADPYIRVYFRSIAKYLLLDPEEILKRFYEERGVPAEAYRKDSKLTISLVENKRTFKPWVLIVSAIAVLAIFSFIVNKSGAGNSGANDPYGEKASVKKQHSDAEGKNMAGASGDSAEDSLIGALIPHNEPAATAAAGAALAAVTPPATSPPPAEKKETAGTVDAGKLLTLEVRAVKDSVWVQIFSDGQSWKRYMYANQSKRFTARDSFNVHVGNNSILRYTFNNKPLTVHANDVAVFKLSRSGPNPEMWNLSKWAGVFKNRT
jgi:cytoskeletal protein RodZ